MESERDIVTVVSIMPYDYYAYLPTVYPGTYTFPAVKDGDLTFNYIRNARTDIYIDSDRGMIQRPILSDAVARSIVNDHLASSILRDQGVAEPGIFWLEGKKSKAEIFKTPELEHAREKQKKWFIKLVEQADIDWNKTGNARAIGMVARHAARVLQITREWDIEQIVQNIHNCPMCQTIVSPLAVICSNCKFILNKEVYERNKAMFAQQPG